MTNERWLIVATAVGALGTIIAPIISWYLSKEKIQKSLGGMSSTAKAILNKSTWTGRGILEIGPKDYHGEYEANMLLNVNGKMVSGFYSYKPIEGITASPHLITPQTTIPVRGGFVEEGLLRLNFQSEVGGDPHFGIFLFHLDEVNKELDGKWLGLGLHAKNLIAGSAKLHKVI